MSRNEFVSDELNKDLLDGVLNENAYQITKSLKEGANINFKDLLGQSVLHLAVKNRNTAIIKLLIDCGIDQHLQNKDGLTALHAATKEGRTKLVSFLIKNGYHVNIQDKYGRSALHHATSECKTDIVKLLIVSGINLKLQDKDGWTALHSAARTAPAKIVLLLIDNHIDLNIQDENGRSALHHASETNRKEIAKLLVAGGISLDLQDMDGRTALHVATMEDNRHMVQLLIDSRIDLNLHDKDGTALHAASKRGNTEIVKLLLDYGTDINLQETHGWTAFHNCAWYWDAEIIDMFIEKGINLNMQTNDDSTALHLAANVGNTRTVMLLIKNGIVVNSQDRYGNSALHHAIWNRHTQIAKSLIDGSIDVNLQDKDGNTALHITCMSPHPELKLVTYFLNHECNPKILNYMGKKPTDVTKDETVKQLLENYENKSLFPGLPFEVKKFDKKSADVFSKILGQESYPHFESRFMLAGEQGTGKTTIARYLVGKQPTRKRKSTDGIELYNGLAYMDREKNVWLGGSQDFSLDEVIISRSLQQEETSVNLSNASPISKDVFNMTEDASFSVGKGNLYHESYESSTLDVTPQSVYSDKVSFTSSVMTKYENIKPLPVHQNETVPVNDDNFAEHKTQILPAHVSSKQKTKKQDKDDNYQTSSKDKISSLESRPGRLVSDEKSSDGLVNSDKIVVQDNQTGEKSNDHSNDRKIDEAPFKGEEQMKKSDGACLKRDLSSNIHLQKVNKPGVIKKLKHFFGVTKNVKEVKVSITKESFLHKSSEVGRKKLHDEKIAPIIIWDFGGQDVFYSTHQTFLTYRAIYMIVLDGSRNLDDRCPYEQYLPGKTGHKTARDYLLFWINTIVTYCKGSIQGFPKIMVVLTHKDKVQAKFNEVDTTRQRLFAEIRQLFAETPLMQHLVIDDQIFVNARDKYDPEMQKIKNIIISQSKKQPTWGESLPKCFIPLELEFASLIRRNIPLITVEHLNTINSAQPIRPLSEPELKVFLKFQHSIGKILYFDEHKLDKHIILSPTLLIDAFKSIVTDRRFCKGDKQREDLWDVMGKQGVVSKNDIQTVWKKKKYRTFYNDKEYLQEVMTHLDILAEPKRYDSDNKRIPADFYYIASMVRATDDSGYLQSAGFTKRSIAIVFQSSSLMIPPALSFRFLSYCLYVWAVKTYGETNKDMLFHRSGVFTIDPSLDMYIMCEDETIIARLVHARTNALIKRDLASSIKECLTSALERISQLYIRTSSDENQTNYASFIVKICCNSPDNPCILKVISKQEILSKVWICPEHGIEHKMHTITAWFPEKDEDMCEQECPVTNAEFLRERPTDLDLRRLTFLYNTSEIRELALQLDLKSADFDNLLHIEDTESWKFEVVRKCRNSFALTFRHIKEAHELVKIPDIHRLCKLVKGDAIDFDREPEKWDLVLTEKHIDRLAPLIGNNSLKFLIELEMEFNTWEQIHYRHGVERDLVKQNREVLEEWRNTFCKKNNLKPTLRKIAQAFSNIGKHIEIVQNTLSDLF